MGFHELSQEELDDYDPSSDDEMIIWEKNRPLKWSDFEGSPDPENKFGALTESILCRKCDAKVIHIGNEPQFQIINIKVCALFHKPHSWVKKSVLESDKHAIILKHEQGHFDTTEIFARKLRKKLDEAATENYPCKGKTKEDQQKHADSKLIEILDSIGTETDKETKSFDDRYENDTDHGKNIKQQGKYNLEIEKLLKES